MDSGLDLNAIPLSTLSHDFRTIISCLLNSKKILLSDGPEKLPRDWRGIASLIQISTEVVGNINEYTDKTAQVLSIWIDRNDGTATLGRLMEYVQRLDRFDVYDDLCSLIEQGKLTVPNTRQVALNNKQLMLHDGCDELITSHDRRAGCPQYYDAMVLFAEDDRDFAKLVLGEMLNRGFKLCTIDDLDAGYPSVYPPVTRLISERCRRVVLICSPAFFQSPANTFYTNYAQAAGIEFNQRKMIPLIYRECKRPGNMSHYHSLKYYAAGQRAPYDLWLKLAEALAPVPTVPAINGVKSSRSAVDITELSASSSIRNGHLHPGRSAVTEDLTAKFKISQLEDTRSLGNLSGHSQSSQEKKKSGVFRKMLSKFKTSKEKNLHK